jgi:zinc/manganese transport system substrate-binding protein
LAALPALALALSGCADVPLEASGPANPGEGVAIVASINVYGDVAQRVAGDLAGVTSIVTSAAQDPHEYEASAQDRLAVDKAGIVIKNGGGFDPFMDTLLAAGSAAAVIDAVAVSGLDVGGDGNEHVWYSFAAIAKVAAAVRDELAALDPGNAEAYDSNYQAFADELAGLDDAAADLRPTADGKGVAITEPVPLYLLEAVGLVNQTPPEFSEAVEEGADVPPRALQDMLDLLASGQIAVLAYNSQTADNTTEQVRQAANTAGIPVVEFTELLPEGLSYVQWQRGNIAALAAALGEGAPA